MHPHINQMIANDRVAARISAAERRRAAQIARANALAADGTAVTSGDSRTVTSWLRVTRRTVRDVPAEGRA